MFKSEELKIWMFLSMEKNLHLHKRLQNIMLFQVWISGLNAENTLVDKIIYS